MLYSLIRPHSLLFSKRYALDQRSYFKYRLSGNLRKKDPFCGELRLHVIREGNVLPGEAGALGQAGPSSHCVPVLSCEPVLNLSPPRPDRAPTSRPETSHGTTGAHKVSTTAHSFKDMPQAPTPQLEPYLPHTWFSLLL